MRVFFFFIFFLLCGFAGLTQKSFFTATVDKQRIVIGEPFQLRLNGTVSSAKSAEWARIDSFPYFEILSSSKVDTTLEGAQLHFQQTITLTSWDSGKWQIPAFSFAGNRSKPISVTVSFAPFDPAQDYHDIKEIIEVEKPERVVWYWYLALALFLLILAALMFPSKKRQPLSAEPRIDETVFKKSLAQLDALRQQADSEDSKTYYTTLVHIFRAYLQKRKSIESTSKTTEDLMRQLSALKLKREEALRQTLAESDMVKFAKYQPSADEKQTALQIIREAIIEIEDK